jgi:Na+-transporting methylmalonyl-CoA/oxaloacetate decarboxylase gamma subunit
VHAGDALIISLLGITVVFAGLSLTSLLIFAVAKLPQLAAKLRTAEQAPRRSQPDTLVREPVDPTIVAVIAAALEVERRLHRAERGRRLTIEPRT